MRRWIVAAVMLIGAVVIAVEGYYLYIFYAEPGAGEQTAGRSAPETEASSEDETRQAPAAGSESEGQPASKAEDETRTESDEARYLQEVEEAQTEAVAAFLDSHEKLRRYDSLTADDVETMGDNSAVLRDLAARVGGLDPPPQHEKQYEVFKAAISDLEDATALAYELVADPVSATRPRFDQYDRLVEEAATGLRRSNELLNRDYETVRDVRDVGV